MQLGELVPLGGRDIIPLIERKLLVGRRSHCDICLRFSNVSSHHCEFELKDGYWYVRDLGSSNGTKVNGVRVDSQCLRPGDEVMISKHGFTIHFNVEDGTEEPVEANPFELSLMEKAGLQVERPRNRKAGANASRSKSVRKNSSKDDFLMEWLSED